MSMPNPMWTTKQLVTFGKEFRTDTVASGFTMKADATTGAILQVTAADGSNAMGAFCAMPNGPLAQAMTSAAATQ
jgi:hypothetical protein